MTEIRYAALLHDFGKVGVREQVLVKAKKLYEHERDCIRQRVRAASSAASRSRPRSEGRATSREAAGEGCAEAGRDRRRRARAPASPSSTRASHFILQANEPTVLAQGGFERHRRARRA